MLSTGVRIRQLKISMRFSLYLVNQ